MAIRKIIGGVILSVMLLLSGCAGTQEAGAVPDSKGQAVSQHENKTISEEKKEYRMKLTIDGTAVPVTWEDNASTAELHKLVPLTIKLSPYGGFEQVGSIGQNIVSADKQTTTQYGDIVLYAGNKLVIFYGSNSWAYTRLGHIELSQQEMTALLNRDEVTVTLTAE
ncbi:cyclophilin-like fold protein [uncultured Anaerovibrio sp.]|uniref:cyclophilin-like fold protein n=1 Tax=uncultured Anaerovibrio sp. TaxID=361586 RepID=UPI0026227D71|nr:cyclophilin-like fold protein [uncultured Anaerovibrio sp.]